MRLLPLGPKNSTVLGLAGLLLAACGGSGPSTGTPSVTRPPATPSTPPTSSTESSFYHASCPLGPGTLEAECGRPGEKMLDVYEEALDYLIAKQPGIFDLTDEAADSSRAYRVKDKEAYLEGIVAYVRGRGMCAERDPDDGAQETVRMKLSKDFSEQYDTLLSSGHMRRGLGAYRETCTPASFPVERTEDAPPASSGCGRPYPPEVSKMNCKVHTRGPEYYTLDSTPLVGPNPSYCAAIGYTDGRTICPLRLENAPDRVACENWRTGNAQDTGRPGPTWRKADGGFCTGPASGCANHPTSQYALLAYLPGSYVVSAANGASCTVSY